MAKVSKRTWMTPSGEKRTAFVLTYMDGNGLRHRKQFAKKTDADAERVRVEGELAGGIHVPDRDSRTVGDAAKEFLADYQGLVRAGKRTRTTMDFYERHIRLHLDTYDVAKRKLSRLTGPDCVQYARGLEVNLSDDQAPRVFALFRKVIKFAQASGWIASNPAAAVAIRTGGTRSKSEAGEIRFPPKDQLKALYAAARAFDTTGQAEAIVSVLMFGGLRISELIALPRRALFLNVNKLKVLQRADRYRTIGPVKTDNGMREVPLPPATVLALRTWLPHAPISTLGLVFPTSGGTGKGGHGEGGGVQNYHNLYNRFWVPLMTAAGLVEWRTDGADGELKAHALFGFHTLRHVAISLWIEQGATPKQVTTWAGHASIQFTMDTYGKLWADNVSDQAIAAKAQASVIG